MFNAQEEGPSQVRQVTLAVVTAALTTAAHGLVTWGIQELQMKFGSKRKQPEPPPEKEEVK